MGFEKWQTPQVHNRYARKCKIRRHPVGWVLCRIRQPLSHTCSPEMLCSCYRNVIVHSLFLATKFITIRWKNLKTKSQSTECHWKRRGLIMVIGRFWGSYYSWELTRGPMVDLWLDLLYAAFIICPLENWRAGCDLSSSPIFSILRTDFFPSLFSLN